ncbi:MAG: DUF4491 family protein [Bacteroidales bacterium]|nr:DUF4491 family protein [Bacteroidales bacterium]MBD5217664.1 DUF4491 family protein [Bacteroidales bacterium]MBD5221556.1 DUF4491 family protein [Bacteroidales bacterium]
MDSNYQIELFGKICNFEGLTLGLCTFLIIGLFHPLVIKGEYYFGRKVNVFFILLGVISLIGSVCLMDAFMSALLGVVAFSSFWSIREVYDQEKRVEKGWFPANPKRRGAVKSQK